MTDVSVHASEKYEYTIHKAKSANFVKFSA
jgi:hypothetical protein